MLLVLACGKIELNQANKSLQGEWSVVRVYRLTPDISNGSSNLLESFNPEEMIRFEDNWVEGAFSLSKQLINWDTTYSLTRTLQNAGFVRVPIYQISIGEEIGQVRFGDETSDAQKGANQIEITFPNSSGDSISLGLDLQKLN